MIYCKHCYKNYDESKSKNCPKCHTNSDESLTEEEKTLLLQELHHRSTDYNDESDKGKAKIVLGSIFLIIGILFLIVAQKPVNVDGESIKVLKFNSFEFVVSMVGFILGGVSLIYGLIRVIICTRIIRVTEHDILEIGDKSSTKVGKTNLWIVDFINDTDAKIYNKRQIRKAEKAKSLKK